MTTFLDYDGIIVDPETGEIVNFPDRAGNDHAGFLAARRAEADLQVKRWESLKAFYGEKLGEFIDQTPEKKIRVGDYAVQWVEPKDREAIPVETLDSWMVTQEMPVSVRLNALLATTKNADPKKVREVFGGDFDESIVVKTPVNRYIKQDVIAKAAPTPREIPDPFEEENK